MQEILHVLKSTFKKKPSGAETGRFWDNQVNDIMAVAAMAPFVNVSSSTMVHVLRLKMWENNDFIT